MATKGHKKPPPTVKKGRAKKASAKAATGAVRTKPKATSKPSDGMRVKYKRAPRAEKK